MKRFLKEPLLHFLLMGAALFVVFRMTSAPAPTTENQILISEGVVDHMNMMFSRTWQRPPTDQELKGLLRDYIRDEVAYREAMDLGLDRDDSIIRRRLRQKLEMLSDETAEIREPSDEELQTLLNQDPDKYAIEPELSFVQVYINPDRHKEDVNGYASALLQQFQSEDISGDTAAELGDPTMLPSRTSLAPLWMIKRTFGSQFAEAVADSPTGEWIGPIVSGFGLHLVRIDELIPGRTPGLEEVRDAVLRDWQAANKKKALDELYQQMTAQYEIVIEDESVAGLLKEERE